MKKIVQIFCLILCLSFLNACNKKENTYDVYVNGKGYNLGDKLIVEVSLKTEDKDIKVCPVIHVKKEGESDIGKIADGLSFSTENVEFINLYLNNFSEILNKNYWTFETVLTNDGEFVDLSNGAPIEKINLILKEKGNYTIFLEEKLDSNECNFSYKNSLSLSIIN